MAAGPLKRSATGGGRRGHAPMSEINVTPLVDVMLVLLIVFMVAAPLLTVGVPVDLPETKAGPVSEEVEPLTISIDKKGDIYLQDTKVTQKSLIPRVQAVLGQKPDTRIYVRGDERVGYGKVMVIMGLLNEAGFTRIALITDQDL